MAKLTSNGVTIEGTPEELAVIMKQFTVEADEVESEEVAEDEALEVGDYAVVIKPGVGGADVFTPGQIVKATFVKDPMGNVLRPLVKSLDGQHEWYMTIGEEIRKATEAEAAQAEADEIKRKRTEVFTANGRKVNELRKGDIVRVKRGCGAGDGIKDGDAFEVTEDSFTSCAFVGNGWAVEAEPLVFVENRLDRN
jgi:hypothetical protein